jgi:hypothetical protein
LNQQNPKQGDHKDFDTHLVERLVSTEEKSARKIGAGLKRDSNDKLGPKDLADILSESYQTNRI